MFPKEAEPPPCFVLETDETVRLPTTRPRNMSQLTLVSLQLPHPAGYTSAPQAGSAQGREDTQALRDDCDEWQLVHRRVSVANLLARFRRRPRRPSLPVTEEGSQAAGSATTRRERLRRPGQTTLHSVKGSAAEDISRGAGQNVDASDVSDAEKD